MQRLNVSAMSLSYLLPKSSDSLPDLHQSLAHKGFATDFKKLASTYQWVCLQFLQTLMHRDLGTYFSKESLKLGVILSNSTQGVMLQII
jgi:hypothetical protein